VHDDLLLKPFAEFTNNMNLIVYYLDCHL